MRMLLIILLFNGFLFGCGVSNDRELSISEYQRWLASSESGLRKNKTGRLVNINALFIPSDLMTYRELNALGLAYSVEVFDSVRSGYKKTLNFSVELQAKETGQNLLWYGLTDYTSYQARIHELSFSIESFISLKVAEETYYPVLAHFEGYNELSNKLIFHVAFMPGKEVLRSPGATIRLTFDDPCWRTGTNHFTFKKEDFDNMPQLAIG